MKSDVGVHAQARYPIYNKKFLDLFSPISHIVFVLIWIKVSQGVSLQPSYVHLDMTNNYVK